MDCDGIGGTTQPCHRRPRYKHRVAVRKSSPALQLPSLVRSTDLRGAWRNENPGRHRIQPFTYLLVIPPWMVGGTGELRLMADPITSRQVHTSEAIMVPQKGSLHWRIQNGMRVSWLTIRY